MSFSVNFTTIVVVLVVRGTSRRSPDEDHASIDHEIDRAVRAALAKPKGGSQPTSSSLNLN